MHPYLPLRRSLRRGSTQNQENLLIFAAGNGGAFGNGSTLCTIASPAIGKNALAVGATSSGETRLSATGADGQEADGTNGYADVDTVAYFSSFGPTRDGRIKPEVVAPGDAVRKRAVCASNENASKSSSDACSNWDDYPYGDSEVSIRHVGSMLDNNIAHPASTVSLGCVTSFRPRYFECVGRLKLVHTQLAKIFR